MMAGSGDIDEYMRRERRELRRAAHVLRFFPRSPLEWIGPLAAAALAGIALVALVLASGFYSFAASQADPAGLDTIIHSAFMRSTEHHAGGVRTSAAFGTAADVAKGAGYFGTACAHCHGGPGLGQNPIVLSMRPRPQYLPAVLGQFDDQALFRIVKHGVKMSGMPAFPVQDRDDEVWSVVSFLRALPTLTTAQYRALAYGDADTAKPAPVPALADPFVSRPYPANGGDELAADFYRRTSPAIGFDDVAMRGDVTGYCARCHVDGGRGRAGGAIPDITLLDARYFRHALNQFATGKRHSALMLPVATQLSPAQIDALARWYAAQPKRAATPAAPGADLALGERIAVAGLNARRADACSNCHDLDRASAAAYPTIDGQHAGYLAGRMRQYRASPLSRGNPMPAIARRLDDRAIDAVSAFYGARSPAARTTGNASVPPA